jgi:CheY-like chemotaxis protein
MAQVLALVPDLLFGSRLVGALAGAGHEVELIADEGGLRERLKTAAPGAVLVVDLTKDDLDGAGLLESLSREGALQDVRTLGFYAHVEQGARERAAQAGFDMAVPRSRMARDVAELIARLAAMS